MDRAFAPELAASATPAKPMAIKTTLIMIHDRTVGTAAPDRRR